MSYIGNNPRLKSIVSTGDTLTNLTAEPRVAGRLVYATDEFKFYIDDGSSLTEVSVGAASGLFPASTGELVTYDGSDLVALTVGIDGQVLTADSADAYGIKWVTPAAVPSVITAIGLLDIDWSIADVFYKDVSVNTTFTFSGIPEGKTIIVIIKNTAVGSVTITFPTILKASSFVGDIAASKETAFTFVRSNSKTYATAVVDME